MNELVEQFEQASPDEQRVALERVPEGRTVEYYEGLAWGLAVAKQAVELAECVPERERAACVLHLIELLGACIKFRLAKGH